jgi:hypothetical protein
MIGTCDISGLFYAKAQELHPYEIMDGIALRARWLPRSIWATRGSVLIDPEGTFQLLCTI